jgi:hypothetical protein
MEIKDYSDYLIYDDSRVFSKRKNRFMKSSTDTNGYKFIRLCKNGKYKYFSCHRLVAIHYIPNPENKSDVDHIDGNPLNNNVNNLRWTTHLENMNNYKSIRKDNTSGHKNIIKYQNGFRFDKIIYGKKYIKCHKNLNELLWFKFVFLIIHHA